jgi:hypothetical protein
MRCPICKGEGEMVDDYDEWRQPLIVYTDSLCHGSGKVNIFTWLWWKYLLRGGS